MIIDGGSRSNWRFFSTHLMRTDTNESVRVVDIHGLGAQDVREAFREMACVADGTRCRNFFYIVSLNPREGEELTPEQWARAREIAAKQLGLEGQPGFAVEHFKDGRTHQHLVLSRIDADTMTAISDSLTYRKHEAASRQIEREFGLEPVESVLVKDRETERPERHPQSDEVFRGKETGIDPREMKAELTALWQSADSGQAFRAALEDAGYILARGDRRDFCIIDSVGHEHSLGRRLGVKAAEVRARMSDINRDELPTVAEAREMARAAPDSDSGEPVSIQGEQRDLAEPELPGRKPQTESELPGQQIPQTKPEQPGAQSPVEAGSADPGAEGDLVRTPAEDDAPPQRVTPWGNAWRALSDRFTRYAGELSALWQDESGAPSRDIHDASPQVDAAAHQPEADTGAAAKSWVARVMENKAMQAGRRLLHGWGQRDGAEMVEGIRDAAAVVEDILAKGPHPSPGPQRGAVEPSPEAQATQPAAPGRPMTALERLAAASDGKPPQPLSKPQSALEALAQRQATPGANRPEPQAPERPDYPVPDFD